MIYFRERYVRTKDNRIFKLDGWNPIAEYRNGLWLKTFAIDSETILKSIELRPDELLHIDIESSMSLDKDNVDTATLFAGVVFTSTALKYYQVNLFVDSFRNEKKHFSSTECCFNETTREKIWIECFCHSYIYFRGLNFISKSSVYKFDSSIGEPFLAYGAYQWFKLSFPKTEFSLFDFQDLINDYLGEYDKAAMDKNRVERAFYMFTWLKDEVKTFGWSDKVLFCLANRIYYRLVGAPEDLMYYSKEAPFWFGNGVIFDTYFHNWTFSVFMSTIKESDPTAAKIFINELKKLLLNQPYFPHEKKR